MSNPTSNFGWQMPTNTDLVSQLPADFEVFGQAVDTSLMDLKGGTTGQVLAKASNADMDFVWSADAAGMTNPMTTTGDTIYSSSGSTPARLAIGSTGDVLTVAGGLPSWVAPTSGGMTLLSTTTLSGSSVTLSSIPATYNNLFFVVRNYRPSTSTLLRVRFNADATANRHSVLSYGAGDNDAVTFNSTSVYITSGENTTTSQSLIAVTIPDYKNTTTWKWLEGTGMTTNETTATSFDMRKYTGFYNQTAAISSLEFFVSTGTMNAGTILLYGVK